MSYVNSPMDNRKQVRLLVVNDQDNYCALLREHVELNSHLYDIECRFVHSAGEALRIMSVWAPSVVLLDAFINDMNSFEFLRRCDGSHMPVVVVSAHGSIEIERSAMENGAAAYFPGSEDPDTLDHLIERIVHVASDRGQTH